MATFMPISDSQFDHTDPQGSAATVISGNPVSVNGMSTTDGTTAALKSHDVSSVGHLPAWKQLDFYSGMPAFPESDALRVRPYPPPPQMQPNLAGYPAPQDPQHYGQEMFFQPIMEPRRAVRKRRRPPHSYASMIAQAILTSPGQKMTLRDIYEWVQTRYPYLYEANETGWQNTIRHNLSLNRCFVKLPRTLQDGTKGRGKGGYWGVDLEQLNNTTFGRQLLDSGVPGGFEYWRAQPPLSMQPSGAHPPSSNMVSSSPSMGGRTGFEFDFDSQSPASFYGDTMIRSSPSSTTPTSFFSRLRRPFSSGSISSASSTSTSVPTGSAPGSNGQPHTMASAAPLLAPANLATLQYQQQHQHQIANSKMHLSSMQLDTILN